MDLKKKTTLLFTSRVRANDEPHGVFSLKPEQQSVVVVGSGSQVNRALVVNVTRLAGLFGNASVGYRIGGGLEEVMDIKEMVGERAEGRLFFSEGQTSSAVTVLISREVTNLLLHAIKGGCPYSCLSTLTLTCCSKRLSPTLSLRCFCQ